MNALRSSTKSARASLRPAPPHAPTATALDDFLAQALRGAADSLPEAWEGSAIVERITYHGVASLLANMDRLQHWPATTAEAVRALALAQAMWELRHAAVLRGLLERLAEARVPTLLLKGTAIAYELYDHPADRPRGDSDLLIHERDLARAREILAEVGFIPPGDGGFLPAALRAQESWVLNAADGSQHWIDLHWRPMNSPALDRTFATHDWFADTRSVPALSGAAFAPSRPRMLLHACVHRSVNECSPYQVGDQTHFGGNRLIWLWDIALLGRSMDDEDWRAFCRLARESGVANACRDGLDATSDRLGPIQPQWVDESLASGSSSAYLAGGQLKRALLDLMATPGVRGKWHYARARALPDPGFVRAKYPRLAGAPLPLLYGKRVFDLLIRRG